MTATEVIARQNQAFSQPGPFASVLQPLVNRTMALMERRGLLTTSADVEKLVRPPGGAKHVSFTYASAATLSENQNAHFGAPEIPVTGEAQNAMNAGLGGWLEGTQDMIAGIYPRATEGIPVTEEMIAGGVKAHMDQFDAADTATYPAIYRAMAALAPKESSTWAFQEHRIAVSEAANLHLRATVAEKSDRIAALEADLLGLRGYCEVLEKRDATRNATIAELEHDIRMLMSDKVGDHDYHGPVKDGKAVPDESHERFHGSIGDVLSGNIIRPARDQMEKALADARAKDGKGVPSIPTGGRSSDPRRIGG